MADYSGVGAVGGKWAKASEIAEGTKAKILSEVMPVESRFTAEDGSSKKQNVGKVIFKGSTEPVNLNFNRATLMAMKEAFGGDSKGWIGKVLTVHTEKVMVAGKRVTALYLIPDGFEVGENSEGYIELRRAGVERVEDVSDDINPEDIPF